MPICLLWNGNVTLTFKVKDQGANALKSRYRASYWEQGVEFDMCVHNPEWRIKSDSQASKVCMCHDC